MTGVQTCALPIYLTNHNGGARDGLQYAILAALDALGDFDFAFAREQGHGSHLAQVHADGVVGFFQGSGAEVEFDVLGGFFSILEFFIERRRGHFRALEHIDALRADSGQQIVEVVGTVHVMRYEVVDLVIREISLLFSCVDQLLDRKSTL